MLDYTVSEADFLLAQRLNLGWKARGIPLALWLFATAHAGLVVLLSPGRRSVVIAAAFAIGLGWVLFGLVPRLVRRHFKKTYAQYESLHEKVKIDFDAAGVRWHVEAGTFETPWREMVRHKSNESLLVMYEEDDLMRIIPLRAFEDEAEHRSFLARLAGK